MWSFREGKIYTIFAPGGCRSSYWAPGGYTETPGCIRWLHGYSRMYTVAIRRFPDVYGGYTETPECIRWLYGYSRMYTVATRRYTAPTRSDTDHFSSVYSGTKNCAGLIFSPDMPDHAGSCRTTPDAFPVSTRMMPEITRIIPDLNPGWSGMRSVNVWKPQIISTIGVPRTGRVSFGGGGGGLKSLARIFFPHCLHEDWVVLPEYYLILKNSRGTAAPLSPMGRTPMISTAELNWWKELK